MRRHLELVSIPMCTSVSRFPSDYRVSAPWEAGVQGTPSTKHPPLFSSVLPLALILRGLGCTMSLSGLECFQLEKSGSLLGGGDLSNYFCFYLHSKSLI